MGFFSNFSLNNIGNAIHSVTSQISLNNLGGIFSGIGGGSSSVIPEISQSDYTTSYGNQPSDYGNMSFDFSQILTPTSESIATPQTPPSNTHTAVGNVIAGIANAVTGGLIGNGQSLQSDSVSQAQANAIMNSSSAYQGGVVAGHIINSALTPITGQVSTVLQNAVKSTPVIQQVMDGVSDFAIRSVQKTVFEKIADFVKANSLLVVAISLIPIYFIFKPFLGAKKSTKRRYKR